MLKAKHILKRLFPALGIVLALAACSEGGPGAPEGAITVEASPALPTEGLQGEIAYGAYIFRKGAADAEYGLYKAVYPFVSGSDLELELAALDGAGLRFLFTAMPAGVNQNDVVSALTGETVSPLAQSAAGLAWSSVRFVHPGVALTADYYYGVTDITGADLIAAGKVEGILTRFVGQMTYDIFKVSGSLTNPVGVSDTENVLSVIDRVYLIEEDCAGLTARLKFDGTTLVADTEAEPYTLENTITPVPDGSTGKVTLAEARTGGAIEKYAASGEEADLYLGAARIRGAYLFPAADGVEAVLTFHYYDTTPICGGNHADGQEGHTLEGCYVKPAGGLPLYVSRGGSVAVKANHYTANKIGIPCDRVIDIPLNSGLNIITGWSQWPAGEQTIIKNSTLCIINI